MSKLTKAIQRNRSEYPKWKTTQMSKTTKATELSQPQAQKQAKPIKATELVKHNLK